MKKGLFLLALVCFSASLMAQDVKVVPESQDVEVVPESQDVEVVPESQDVEVVPELQDVEVVPELQSIDTVRIKGVHPYKEEENLKGIAPEIAHWSLIPHFGFSAFDGDFTNEMEHRVAVPTLGIAVEYNFTPIWNVGAEYMYDMYAVTGKQGLDDAGNPLQNADTLLYGHMHKAGAYVSMDVINLFFPRINQKIVSILPYFGAGGAWYKRSKYYMDDKWYDAEKGKWINDTHARGNTSNYINADGVVGPEHDDDYKMVGYIQAGANVEFNINRTIALGVRANYTYFTRDYVDGRGYHKQSSSSYASKNDDGIFDITANLRFKLEAVSKSHPRNMPSFDKFDEFMAAAAEDALYPCCHDTIIYYHDSIIIRETKNTSKKEVYNVYFDNDKYKLRQDGLVTVQQVAERLEEDPELYVVVIGYCDNTGGNSHNFTLGDNRANAVVDELIHEYEIPADHLYGKGTGKLIGRRSKASYGPNRRAAIHLVDEETFELMKLELNGISENRDPETFQPSRKPIREPKFVPLDESARKEKVNVYASRSGESVTSDKNMSLTKLARLNYDNIYCWVYIYLANKDKISNPNAIPEGVELLIPELTEEELKITKEESLRLYSLRHVK